MPTIRTNFEELRDYRATWSGYLTIENAKEIGARWQDTFEGQRFTKVSTGVEKAVGSQTEVNTGLTLEKIVYSETRNDEGGIYFVRLGFSDTRFTFGLSTRLREGHPVKEGAIHITMTPYAVKWVFDWGNGNIFERHMVVQHPSFPRGNATY